MIRMAVRHGTATAHGIVVGFQALMLPHYFRSVRGILPRESTDVCMQSFSNG